MDKLNLDESTKSEILSELSSLTPAGKRRLMEFMSQMMSSFQAQIVESMRKEFKQQSLRIESIFERQFNSSNSKFEQQSLSLESKFDSKTELNNKFNEQSDRIVNTEQKIESQVKHQSQELNSKLDLKIDQENFDANKQTEDAVSNNELAVQTKDTHEIFTDEKNITLTDHDLETLTQDDVIQLVVDNPQVESEFDDLKLEIDNVLTQNVENSIDKVTLADVNIQLSDVECDDVASVNKNKLSGVPTSTHVIRENPNAYNRILSTNVPQTRNKVTTTPLAVIKIKAMSTLLFTVPYGNNLRMHKQFLNHLGAGENFECGDFCHLFSNIFALTKQSNEDDNRYFCTNYDERLIDGKQIYSPNPGGGGLLLLAKGASRGQGVNVYM